MDLDKEITAPESEKKETGTDKIKEITKQSISEFSEDEHLQNMKDMYGETEDSFIKWMRGNEEYAKKCQKMSDKEVLEFAKTDLGLREYHSKIIDKKINKPKEDNKPEVKPTDKPAEPKKEPDKKPDEKPKEDVKKKDNKPEVKTANKPAEPKKESDKKPDEKSEPTKDTPKEDKKSESAPKEDIKKQDIKPAETPDNKPADKPAEPKKEPDKKPDEKPKEKKKHFRSNRFEKKENKESKEKKPGLLSRIGSWIGKWIKAIPHQTWNAISYAPRVARSTAKYIGFDWINHGLNKPGLKKNRDNYASKWKWEQAKKK